MNSSLFILYLKLQFIDDFADISEYFLKDAIALNIMVKSLFLVPVNERSCLTFVNGEPLVDSLLIVV